MDALAALATEHPDNAAAMLDHPGLRPRLQAILCQERVPGSDMGWSKEVLSAPPSEGHTLMAAHVLLHVLAYGVGELSYIANADKAASQEQGQALLREAQHAWLSMRLQDAAELVDVRLPAPVGPAGEVAEAAAAAATADAWGDDWLALPAVRQAELQHTVHDVLLQRLRQRNVSVLCDAAAQLYLLVAKATGGMQAVTEAGLVRQLVGLLQLPDSRLSSACLCLLDALSEDAKGRMLLAEAAWLDSVQPLLDSPDGIVRMLARRALCSVYAREREQEQQEEL